jgi:hypothetical protein
MVEIDWSMPSERVESPVYNLSGEPFNATDHMMLDGSSGRHYAALRFSTCSAAVRYYPVPWTKLVYDTRLGGYVADIDFSRLQKAPSYRKGNQPESPDFRRFDDCCSSHL